VRGDAALSCLLISELELSSYGKYNYTNVLAAVGYGCSHSNTLILVFYTFVTLYFYFAEKDFIFYIYLITSLILNRQINNTNLLVRLNINSNLFKVFPHIHFFSDKIIKQES